jgi:RNase H-fold protein (predicted Holliday junction resolvase)
MRNRSLQSEIHVMSARAILQIYYEQNEQTRD